MTYHEGLVAFDSVIFGHTKLTGLQYCFFAVSGRVGGLVALVARDPRKLFLGPVRCRQGFLDLKVSLEVLA